MSPLNGDLDTAGTKPLFVMVPSSKAETVPCRIPEGVGDSLQAQNWDPALESPGICRNMNYLNLLRISPSLSLSGFKCLDSSFPACCPGYHSLSEAIRLHIVTVF